MIQKKMTRPEAQPIIALICLLSIIRIFAGSIGVRILSHLNYFNYWWNVLLRTINVECGYYVFIDTVFHPFRSYQFGPIHQS